ncbi:hypothetical protein AcW1_000054 [Taiwanofungus camphoratus]|nr:hypothetical protein AcW2_001453 [Antrodia cinnamomea]KAI0962771.1 hypothetical protein AcW1_000054 [Antrodia cinnamomea]
MRFATFAAVFLSIAAVPALGFGSYGARMPQYQRSLDEIDTILARSFGNSANKGLYSGIHKINKLPSKLMARSTGLVGTTYKVCCTDSSTNPPRQYSYSWNEQLMGHGPELPSTTQCNKC